MKEKIANFSSTSSGEVHVGVRPNLKSYYKNILKDLSTKFESPEEHFRLQVNCIVWGAFYIEACTNDILSDIVDDGVQGILEPKQIWDFIERSNTEKKINLIFETMNIEAGLKTKFKTTYKCIFKLRNKLAHPKEKPQKALIKTPADIKASIDPKNFMQNTTNEALKVETELEKEIFKESIDQKINNILEFGSWLELEIFEY